MRRLNRLGLLCCIGGAAGISAAAFGCSSESDVPENHAGAAAALDAEHRTATGLRLLLLSEGERAAEMQLPGDLGIPMGVGLGEGPWGTLRTISGRDLRIRIPGNSRSPSDAARALVAELATELGVRGLEHEIVARRVQSKKNGHSLVRLHQNAHGLPIWRAGAVVEVDRESSIRAFRGLLVPRDRLARPLPRVTAEQAVEFATSAIPGTLVEQRLGYFSAEHFGKEGNEVQLAWRNRLSTLREGHVDVFVSAETGAEIHRALLSHGSRHLEVYSWAGEYEVMFDDLCHATPQIGVPPPSDECPGLYGYIDWGCGDAYATAPCMNPSAFWPGTSRLVYENMDFITDYHLAQHGYDAWDAAGARIHVTANYGPGCSGVWELVPDELTVGTDGACIDMLGHEYTHAVDDGTDPDAEYGVLYGTKLQEGVPDAMGELYESLRYGSTDWITFTGPGCGCTGLTRNIGNPSADGAADNFSNFASNLGSYTNGYIVGKGAQLLGRAAVEGAAVHWGVSVTGVGAALAERIYFQALTECVPDAPTMGQWGQCVVSEACSIGNPTACTQAQNAMDAIGLWRLETYAGWGVGAGTSLSRRTEIVGGFPVSFRYAFYRPSGSQAVQYRSRNCPVSGSCSWSSPVDLGLTTNHAPSSARYQSEIWTCAPNLNNGVVCRRLPIGGAPTTTNLAVSSDAQVAIAEYDGALYFFWKQVGAGVQPLHWKRYHSTQGWSSGTAPFGVEAAPAVASGTMENYSNAANGLWLVYQFESKSGPRIAARRFDPATSTWQLPIVSGNPNDNLVPSGLPTAAMWRGRLHVASRSASNDIYYMSCAMPCDQSSNWTRWVKQDGTASEVNLTGIDTQLLLFHRRAGSIPLYVRGKVGE